MNYSLLILFYCNLMRKWQICYTEMTSVTFHNKCSKILPSNRMHFAAYVRISHRRRELIFMFHYAASSSSRVSTFLSFSPLFFQLHIQKSNGRNVFHIRASKKYLTVCNNTNQYTRIKYVLSLIIIYQHV